jgi:hypothetical protein
VEHHRRGVEHHGGGRVVGALRGAVRADRVLPVLREPVEHLAPVLEREDAPEPEIRAVEEERPFARGARGGDEDSGYVTTLATNVYDYRSEAWVFDAKRITAGPIARVAIPARVAPGFHACWVPGRQLWGSGTARL